MTTTTVPATHRLLRGWWIAKHLFALVILATLIFLGFWQLDRLEQRRAANAARLAALAQPALPLTPETDPATVIGRRVVVSGVFRNEESIVLRGRRSDSGVDGVHLVTPLQIEGSEYAVLVDRGWLPSAQGAATAYAVTRPVTIEGIAQAPQLRPDSPLAGRDLPLPGRRGSMRGCGWMCRPSNSRLARRCCRYLSSSCPTAALACRARPTRTGSMKART